jgi:hypothetical protein
MESIATLGFAVSSVYHSAHEEGAVIQFSPTSRTALRQENLRLPDR